MMTLSDKKINRIKQLFTVGLASYIVIQLIIKAVYTLPEQVLFFVTSDAFENFICASIAYILYYALKREEFWKKVSFSVLSIFILIVLASLKCYRINQSVLFESTFDYFTSFLGQSLLFYLLLYFVNQIDKLNQYKKLEQELYQAKEQLLRNQLHPHFLFNAFNSLYSLSLQNHPETSDYILKLSSMMRYITDETHPNKVSLTKELDFIKRYISIEKIRFGKDANINLIVNGDVIHTQFIEPFLLITLVENAFKHGFYTNAKNAYVHITLSLQNNELTFCVENSVLKKQHFQETTRKGKGLENLNKRLQLLYPKTGELTIKSEEDTFLATLKILLNNV